MPYIATESVKEKRKALRAALPGWKLSVRTENHSTVAVTIVEGPLAFPDVTEGTWAEGYSQLNHYYLGRDFAEDHPEWLAPLETIKEIAEAGMSDGFHDSDYGYVPGHYITLTIGRWNKPYVQKEGV